MRGLLPLLLLWILMGCENAPGDYQANGQKAVEEGDFETAIIEFKNAVRLSPKNADYRYQLGRTYLRNGQFDFATKELERSLELGYDADKVVPLLYDLYLFNNEAAPFAKLNKHRLKLSGEEQAKLLYHNAHWVLQRGLHDKAKALVKELKQQSQAPQYALLGQALQALLENNLQQAIEQIDALLPLFPLQQEALKLQAKLLLNNQEPRRAFQTLTKYVNTYANDDEARFALVRLGGNLGRHSQIEPHIDSLLLSYPSSGYLQQAKAVSRAEADDFEQALNFALEAVRINPENVTARLVAGISAYQTNDKVLAARHLSLIASYLSRSQPALRMLADSQLVLGEPISASETLSQLQIMSSQDAQLFAKVANGLYRVGEVNKAQVLASKQPGEFDTPTSLTNIGLLKVAMKDQTGLSDLEAALTLIKDQDLPSQEADLEQSLAMAYLKTGHFDEAQKLAQKFVEQPATRFKGLNLAATVAAFKGQKQQALELLQTLKAEQGPTAETELKVIELIPLSTIEQRQAVLEQFDELLMNFPDHTRAIELQYLLRKRMGLEDQTKTYLAQRIEQGVPKHKLLLAQILLIEQRPEAVVELFETYERTKVEAFWPYLASALLQTERSTEANELYEQWLSVQPNHPVAISGKIRLLQRKQLDEQAYKLSQRYLFEVGGKDPRVRILHLQLLLGLHRWGEAEAFLTTLPPFIQQSPTVVSMHGHLALERGDYKSAIERLNHSYEMVNDSYTASLLFSSLKQSKQENDAIAFMSRHLAKHPRDIENLRLYADALISKDPKQAIRRYRQLVRYQPEDLYGLNNLAYLLLQAGQLESAHQMAKRAYKVQPSDRSVLDTLGSIELRLGNDDDALKHLKQAYEMIENPIPETVVVNYIEALFKNNQTKLAQRKLAQHQITDSLLKVRVAQLRETYL